MIQTPAPPVPMPDPNLLAGTISELIITVLVVGGALLLVRWAFRSPIAEAIGERIRRGRRNPEMTGEQDERMARLEGDLSVLRGELTEVQERLDFAERVLAEKRERRLGAGQ